MTEASMTLAEWCAHRRVCRSMFYALEKQGRAPRTHRVGVKRLISAGHAEWLRAREAESARLWREWPLQKRRSRPPQGRWAGSKIVIGFAARSVRKIILPLSKIKPVTA